MSKMQARILKKTNPGECDIYTVEIRVKTHWFLLWSDWTTDSSFMFEEDAISLVEHILAEWKKPYKAPSTTELHRAMAVR